MLRHGTDTQAYRLFTGLWEMRKQSRTTCCLVWLMFRQRSLYEVVERYIQPLEQRMKRKQKNVATSQPVNLGEDCQNAFCESVNSACVTKSNSSRVCECVNQYLQVNSTSCQQAPDKLTNQTVVELSVSNQQTGNLGEIPLDIFGEFLSLFTLRVNIIPDNGKIELVISDDKVSLHLLNPLASSTTYAILITATTHDGNYKIQQAVALILNVTKPTKEFSPELIQTFVIEGTRKSSLIADVRYLGLSLGEDDYNYEITSNVDADVSSLFAVHEKTGHVVCVQDVQLPNDTVAKDYSFNITAQADSSPKVTVALVFILVFRDIHEVDVAEGFTGIFMQYVLNTDIFKITEEGLSDDITKLGGGSFQLTKARDYEKPDQRRNDITLSVRTDDGSIQTRIQVGLSVYDKNDEAPSFQDDTISAFILAGSLNGTVIAVAECTDPDTVGTVSYSLSGSYVDRFDVDSSGVVTAVDTLKRSDYGELFVLYVVATDGINPSSNTANITVSLILADAGAKELNKTFYANVKEEQDAGVFVTNVRTANYTNYRFAIKEVENYLTLNSTTGVVKTRKKLDRENQPDVFKFLEIRASGDEQDQCVPVKLGRLHITLIDINDNDPTFAKGVYHGSLTEGSENDTTVSGLANLQATDADTGANANLTYTLSGSTFEIVTIEKHVIIVVKDVTDREKVSHFNLTLTARDNPQFEGDSRTGSTTITIKIIDINDNNPVFENTVTEFSILENELNKDKTLASVTATDKDKGFNADIIYDVQGRWSGYFDISGMGEIYQTQPIDREKDDVFNLTVSATDKGTPPLQTKVKITVHVDDINDNDPMFDTSLLHFVRPEEQHCSLLNIGVTAVDPDEGENGTVKYSLNSTYFNINPNTGVITCTTSLDYETNKVFDLLVTAVDMGIEHRSSNMTVQIRVTDLNDNDPVFSEPFYNASLSRKDWETGKLLLAVSVSDKDSGDNADISLTLDSYNDVFSISSGNIGVLRIKDRSVSSEQSYSFTLTATDHGQPSRSSTTSVHISVVASSENSTVRFLNKIFNFAIEENKKYSRKVIGRVQADVVPGHVVNYAFVGEPLDGFELDPSSGDLICNKTMDREDKAVHQIVAIARDTSEKGYDLALVNVTVTDVNDNNPWFLLSPNQLLFQPFEDIPVNTHIATITAEDPDDGNNGTAGLVYSIINKDAPFTINQTTAVITTTKTLDRETVESYNLKIQVTDGGSPRLSNTTTVQIYLKDVNDNDPNFFPGSYIKRIDENAASGTSLDDPFVYATDPDYGDNGIVTYILNTTDMCPFQVSGYRNVTTNEVIGVVTVTSGNLDYETTPLYTCIISAVDMTLCKDSECQKRRTGTAMMNISVLDNNDNAPVFHGTPYKANISRDEEVGTVVSDVVNATDADSEENGKITFKLLPHTGYFNINSTSGVITIGKSLFNLDQDSIILTVEAKDNPIQDQALQTAVNIIIDITDDNIRPWFNKTYTGNITEEEINTDFGVMVTAYDSKERKNITCNCTYSIAVSKHFTINEKTGLVTQTYTVDREVTGSSLSLEIQATDDGEPVKSTKTWLNIRVIDINDNAPYFTSESYHFSVNQTAPIGSLIGQLNATDADEGENAVSYYFTLFLDKPVELHNNGTITVKESLETGDETYMIIFSVLVLDSRSDIQYTDNNMTAIINITVHFRNPNEHAPEFTKAKYKSSLGLLEPKDTQIKLDDFKAADKDGHVVMYSIQKGNIRDIILINARNGSMKLKYSLDYTIGPSINLTVIAVDNAVYPKTGTCAVEITIRGREPTQCIQTERYSQLKNDSDQRDLYLGLFAAMAILLSIAFIITLCTCYKWRRSHNRMEYYKDLGKTHRLLDAKGEYIGSQVSGYDPLQKSFSVHPYSMSQSSRESFSSGVLNPAYIRSGQTPNERVPCQPPEDVHPHPDYDEDDDDDADARQPMPDRSSRPVAFAPSIRRNSRQYN